MGNNSTSSVMISMDANTVPVKKEIAALERQINKLEAKKLPLEAQMESFNQKAGNARKRVTELKNELSSIPKLSVEQMQESMKSDKFFTMNSEDLSKEIAASKKEMQEFSDKADKAGDEVELLNSQISILKNRIDSLKFTGATDASYSEISSQVTKNLEQAANAADRVGRELAESETQADNVSKSVKKIDDGANEAASGIKSRMKNSLKSVEGSVDKFGKRVANTFKSAFIFSVLYKGLNELKQRLSAMLGTNQQFNTSLNQVKSNLAVAFQPIYQAAMPAINSLMNLLVKATAYIAAFVNALFGASMNSSIDAAREMERTVNAVESGATGASKAEKELTAAIKEKQKQVKALQRENKQLQREYEAQQKAVEAQTEKIEKQISAFEKQIDAIEAAESAMNKSAAAQREAIQANIDVLQKQQNAISKEYAEIQKQEQEAQKKVDAQKEAIDKQIKSINKRIKALQKQQREEEKAKKANEKFTASFDELSTLGSIDADDPTELEIEQLQEEIELLQERKEQIEDIDYSARLEALDAEKEKIQEQIDLLQAQKDAIEDVDLSGSIDVYESRISSLREKIDELNNSVVENPLIEQNELLIEQLQEEIDLLQEQKDAIAEASGAASSFDASGLTNLNDELEDLEENINNNKLLKWITDNGDKLLDFITIIAELSAIVGVVYAAFKGFSGFLSVFASPAGVIALVVIALAGFIAVFGDSEAAVDALKRILEGFAEFLLGVFTGDIDLAVEGLKDIFGGLWDFIVVVFEAIENCLIEFLEWIVKIEEEVFGIELSPDVKSAINETGGYKYYSSSGSITQTQPNTWRDIPALASGAVLPPNKPFYAMLGDQKNGTNLEAPEGLIRKIFQEELDGYESDINITFGGTMGGFVRSLNPKITREKKRKSAFKEELQNA